MSEDSKPQLPAVRATVKGPEHKSLYVNSSRMGISPYDVRMVVGQVIEVAEGQVNEDHATIIMSPEHAKAFLRNLEKTIASYEETFGEIKDPLTVLKQTEEQKPKTAEAKPKAEAKAGKKRAKATRH